MTGPGNIDGILLDLWLRWSEEEGARIEQQETLRELFAEAKSEGLNPKALRAAFRRQFAALNETADARNKREQSDEATEEYLAALARVRTREMIAASDDGSEYGNMSIYDPDFEITKPATRVPDTGAAADASEDAAALSLSEAPHPVANVGEEANGAEAVASVDPASREADDADRQQLAASGFTGDAAVASTEVPAAPILTEPERIAAEMIAQRKALRPHCQRPSNCLGVGKKHCTDCQQAWADSEGISA